MSIEESVRRRIEKLINEGEDILTHQTPEGQVLDQQQANVCAGWINAANHVLELVCIGPLHPYRKGASSLDIDSKLAGPRINQSVGKYTELLKRLLTDVDDGLLSTFANSVRAETFDDLLTHAYEYLQQKRLEGSGILSTAVFEDTLHKIARKHSILEIGVTCDPLITSLNKEEIISTNLAKRCRAAAGVRNSALHAQWNEFTLSDVEAVIELTRELLTTHLA